MAFSLYRRPVLERRNVMWFSSWSGKRRRIAPNGRARGSVRKRLTCRPQLVALEDRLLPSGGYVFQTIDDPNGSGSRGGFNAALGINSLGEIVGGYTDASAVTHGYLLSGGKYTTLDDPNAVGFTDALGINARGDIVGGYRDASQQHGFLLSKGRYTTVDDPNANGFTFAQGINAHGDTVGIYVDASFTEHGFLLSGGQYTTIDDPNGITHHLAINDRGEIVGSYLDAKSNEHGFILSNGQYTTLDAPSAVLTEVDGINDFGEIVGRYDLASGHDHGFLLSSGKYTTVDDPKGLDGTDAFGINDLGKIVGFIYSDRFSTEHGFLATKEHDDALAGPDAFAGRANSGVALSLAPADVANAKPTPATTMAGGSGASRRDDLSRMSSVQNAIVATAPRTLSGSGDHVVSAAAAGEHSARTGDDVFAPIDAVFADILPN
jgi:uncharacterized membrane protein